MPLFFTSLRGECDTSAAPNPYFLRLRYPRESTRVHSSKLRGTDFQIRYRGEEISHADFFSDLEKTDRLGVVAPGRYDGAGAVTLVLAHTTAFYDRYRAEGDDFFAYPDFFTFQRGEPVANYGMLDIWPSHKNVCVPDGANETAQAITDRAINVLLVPEVETSEVPNYEKVQLESLRRNVRRCFVYSPSCSVNEADLEISTGYPDIPDWIAAMFDSVAELKSQKDQWFASVDMPPLRQSFREIELNEALRLL